MRNSFRANERLSKLGCIEIEPVETCDYSSDQKKHGVRKTI